MKVNFLKRKGINTGIKELILTEYGKILKTLARRFQKHTHTHTKRKNVLIDIELNVSPRSSGIRSKKVQEGERSFQRARSFRLFLALARTVGPIVRKVSFLF